MKIIIASLFTLISLTMSAQTPTLSADTTQTSVKLDCFGEKPAYIVDYKLLPCDSVRFIKPDDIHELKVLNSPSANTLLGSIDGYKNGAIVITTKQYAQAHKSNKKEIKKP